MKKIISLLIICTLLISSISTFTVSANTDKEFPFTDVKQNHTSGYLNVKSLWEKGIINGISDTKFGPDNTMTREQVAKIIVLATGQTLTDTKGTFSDVAKGAWHEPYIETAVKQGIVKGIGDGKFGVGREITRQEAAVLLARMADAMGIELMEIDGNLTVTDLSSADEYARESIQLLSRMNVLDLTNNMYNPRAPITRIHFCMFLDRILMSDVRAYNDVIQSWIPVEKPVDEYDSQVLVFEDFENGNINLKDYMDAKFAVLPAKEHLVNDMGKDSKSSLKLTTTSTYAAVELYMEDIAPSTTYYLNYDIKTEGFPEGTFARVNYEWYNAKNIQIGGGYVRNNDVKKNTDWIHQSGSVTSPTPDLAPAYLRIVLSIRGAATSGAVWFDNLEIYKVIYEPVTTYLKLPAYKGIITDPEGESDIRVTSYIVGLGDMYKPEETKLSVSVSDLKGNALLKSEKIAPTSEMDVTFSSKGLAIGDYDLGIKLINTSTNKVLGENHYMLRKRASDYKSRYIFDAEGRLLRDGEPFFPIGAYALGIYDDVIDDFNGTSVDFMIANSVASYWNNKHLFDKLNNSTFSSMLSTESIYMNSLRGQYQNQMVTTIASERPIHELMINDLDLQNQKGHMGYQINNESGANEWANRIGWHHQFLSELDPEHFTYGVHGGGPGFAKEYSRMQDIYCCDDPYPITGDPNDPIWEVWEKSKPVAEEFVNRPVWTALQVSDLKVMGSEPYIRRKRGPNETELRNMAWQAVCAGSQGIIWYAHFHLDKEGVSRPKSETFPEMMRVSDEVDAFSDVILSREDAPDIYPKATRMDRFAYTSRRYNGKTYVFLVNMDSQAQSASIKVEGATTADGIYGKKAYTVASDGYIDVTLEPLGVEILVVDQPEPKSPDCKLNNADFFVGTNKYFVGVTETEKSVAVAQSDAELGYNFAVHKDATVKINGQSVPAKGTISISGVDKLTVTVTSEDGKHKKDYIYNIVRS